MRFSTWMDFDMVTNVSCKIKEDLFACQHTHIHAVTHLFDFLQHIQSSESKEISYRVSNI